MAIWQKPFQIADKNGKPTGRYRVVEWSDEDSEFNPRPKCKCTNGHGTPAQALECLQLREIMKRIDAEMLVSPQST